MSKRFRFVPKSRQQTEREIVREQTDFTKGVWNDIPASRVPSKGLYYLTNRIAYDYGIAGRTGNKMIRGNEETGQAALPNLGYDIKASKSGNTISILPDDEMIQITGADIGNVGTSTALFNVGVNIPTGTPLKYSYDASNYYKGLVAQLIPDLVYFNTEATYYAINVDSTHIYISTTTNPSLSIFMADVRNSDKYSITFQSIIPYTLSNSDIGRFFNWGNGHRYLITACTSTTIVTNDSTAESTTVVGKIEAAVNAFEWHPISRKWILHIDTRIFLSDSWEMNSWTEINRNSVRTPNETRSVIKIYGNNAILFNSAGIFAIELEDKDFVHYHLLNADIPPYGDISSAQSIYGRRYLFSYSRLAGVGALRSRGPESSAQVLHESGTNDLDSGGTDYGILWDSAAMGTSEYFIVDLTPPDYLIGNAGFHFSHYSLYGTKDVGSYGISPTIGAGNNPERYWWMSDIPMIKCFHFVTDGNGCSNRLTTGDQNVFSSYDTQSEIKFFDDDFDVAGTLSILSCFDSQNLEVSGSSAFEGIAAIGASSIMRGSQSGKIISRVVGTKGSRPSQSDVGKLIFFSDGSMDIITAVSIGSVANYDTITVSKSNTRSDMVAAWNPIARKYYDTISDSQLDVRNGFLLKQRFMQPMPNCNTGEVIPGFLFGHIEGDTKLYYSQTGDKSLAGYFHPGHQFDKCDNPITKLSAFPGILIGYQPNGFCSWDIKNTLTMNNVDSGGQDIGEQPITVVLTRTETEGIGILDSASLVKTLEGYDLVITQNREVRTHNGTKFSDNIVVDRIQNKMSKLQAVSAIHYDKVSGLLIYGTESQPYA